MLWRSVCFSSYVSICTVIFFQDVVQAPYRPAWPALFRLDASLLASAAFATAFQFQRHGLLPSYFSFNIVRSSFGVNGFCISASVLESAALFARCFIFGISVVLLSASVSPHSVSASARFASELQFRCQRLLFQRFSFGVSVFCLSASVTTSRSFASALQFRRQRVSSQRFSFDVSVSRLSASVLMSAAFASTFQFRSLRVLPQLFILASPVFASAISISASGIFPSAFQLRRAHLSPMRFILGVSGFCLSAFARHDMILLCLLCLNISHTHAPPRPPHLLR